MSFPKLSPKQALFVREYLVDKNATQAAIRAGYSKKTAQQIGSQNLLKLVIKAEIDRLLEKAFNSIELSVDRILLERQRLALYDVGALAAANPQSPEAIAALPADIRQSVAGWKWDKDGKFIVELVDKQAHLTALDKHKGLYEADNAQKNPIHDLTDEQLQRYIARKAKEAGITLQ